VGWVELKPGCQQGSGVDFANLGIGEDFIDDVTKVLRPNKVALVAEVEEDWIAPVDTRMEAIGGTVFRRALAEVQNQIREENVNAMKADLAQMKAEHAQARADQKAKIQEKVSQLDSKIQTQMQKIKDLHEGARLQAQAKADVLKAKAAAARSKAS
jgi:gas vesicle protein